MYSAELESLREQAAMLERECRWAEAEVLHRDAFRLAVVEGNVEIVAEMARRQGRSCWLQERDEEAEELITLSWTISECVGLGSAGARAVNTLAAIYYSRDEYAEAKRLYETAHEMALDASDDEVIGFCCQNLGILANIAGNLREARTRYLEAIGSTVRSGDTLTAARVYNNLGIVSTDMQEWMEAELYFDRGIEIAQHSGDLVLSAALHANRAKPLIHVGEYGQAHISLASAETIAACISDQGTLAEIEVSRGIIARLQGDLTGAEAHFERALGLTAKGGLERERALAIEGMAELWWDQERVADARTQLREANSIFHAVGSQRDAARTEQLLEIWVAAEA